MLIANIIGIVFGLMAILFATANLTNGVGKRVPNTIGLILGLLGFTLSTLGLLVRLGLL